MTMRWCPFQKRAAATPLFFFLFFSLVLVLSLLIHPSLFARSTTKSLKFPLQTPKHFEFPLDCGAWNRTHPCSIKYPTSRYRHTAPGDSNSTCPDYFRWIHEDLRPWKETGITREMLERAQRTAHFRLVILDGKVYVEKYRDSIQTRALFTLWGIVQLLRWYPGRLPDLELMFDCDDRPVIPSNNYQRSNEFPPPLFRYCSDSSSLDIVFPDWSFWGWAEINIKPWKIVLKDIKEGNKRIKWKDRVPLAYWKGNPYVAPTRADLMKCNLTDTNDWNTLLYIQDWIKESKDGFKQSNLEDQCTHRYKIYIEGWAWSVSEKYILACDSPTLLITPRYHDFFIRGMVPQHHYWPIRESNKCQSLKFAVEWGNNHTERAEAIGRASSHYIQEELKMEYVYDYMFHLLKAYGKLLRFKPKVPQKASEVCPETMACPEKGNRRKFMEESLVTSPSSGAPCTFPPPFDPQALQAFIDEKINLTRQVERWENEYWGRLNKKH